MLAYFIRFVNIAPMKISIKPYLDFQSTYLLIEWKLKLFNSNNDISQLLRITDSKFMGQLAVTVNRMLLKTLPSLSILRNELCDVAS